MTEGIERLTRHHVEFNILVLVSAANAARGPEVYRYLRDRGFLFHQYIPCVEFEAGGALQPWAITGEQWGEFLCGVFDEWVKHDIRRVSVRLFDSILAMLVDGRPNVCHMGRNCCQYFMVEHNGDIYPCDFFANPDLKLGNIMDTSWETMLASPAYRAFGAMKAQWHERCTSCQWVGLCAGDCLKHRFYGTRDPRQLSSLCAGWQRFYAHALDRFARLGREVETERAAREAALQRAIAPPAAPVGRNTPCPCGSGRKFKQCCGRT